MTPAAELRTRQPWRLDALIRYSGDAYRRCARTAKQVAHAHGLTISRGVRYRSGDPSAPLTHALIALATADKTTAFPALAHGIVLVTQLELERLTEVELHTLRAERRKRSIDLQGAALHVMFSGDEDEEERVHSELATLHLELTAIARVLRERSKR